MNQKLQQLLASIQQSDHLSDDEKNALLKTAKELDKEIEIISFKLDRTEKVKRTTAILLEETIEELEQKRKAVEAQNRELEIETALEKVRSRTMAMQQSEELKEIIQVVFDQFIRLDILIEHAGFIMDYKERDDMHIWLADKHAVPNQITIPYFDSPHWNSFNEAREKGIDCFANNLGFEEKNRFYEDLFEFIPALPEETKEYYFSCPGVSISTVLLDNVGLYIENFSATSYTPEENNTLMRFGKVFQQTYTRFHDLQKAEAQTRESQIQLALERVRAKTMAMQHSDELSETASEMFRQIQLLGLETWSCGFNIIDRENHLIKQWVSTGDGRILPAFVTPSNEDVFQRFTRAAQTDRSFYVEEMGGEALKAHYQYMASLPDVKKLLEEFKNLAITPPGFQVFHLASFSCGYLMFITYQPAPEFYDIFKRFAAVFDQTYRRFLDLQNAESQTRESRIQLALERVRAKTMAMHNSTDVGETAAVMVDEMKKLGIVTIRCGIGIMHEPGDMEVWTIRTNENDKSDIIIGWLDMHIHPLLQGAFESWRNKNESYSYELKNEDLFDYYTAINNYPGYPIRYDTTTLPQHIHHNEFYFPEGILFAFSLEQLSTDQRKIFKRFAGVFGQTYRRYLDLKKAEAQAREAKIEAALERVRSRTLAMQKSNELAETAAVLFRQLIGLGIAPNRLYIGVIKDAAGHMEFWVTDEEGNKVSTQFIGDASRNTSMKKMYDAWKAENKSFTMDMQGKELEDYFHYLAEELKVTFKHGLFQKRRIQSIAFFGKGFIGIASPDEQPAETLSLLERFAAVFNLTYTRFSDLKIAEAHAIQAVEDLIKLQTEKKRAEDALTELQVTQKQLIQSEKMASLGELTAGIAHEIQNPLNFVNNFSEVSSELLNEMIEEVSKENYEEVKLILQDVKQNLEKITHHGKRADGIVKGMLQHSRSSSNQKEPTNINALADEYLRLAFHGLRAKDKSFNAALKTDYDESIGTINIVPQDIGRVMLNLITNAFYVVAEKKKSSAIAYDPTVSVNTKKNNNSVEIYVTDNGNGIPKNIIDKIFQPFFTTKPTGQGTGLGLSLAYDIIKAHGGKLKVETKEGQGSIFMIELPNT